MAEDRESSDRKHEKSKKRDRSKSKPITGLWTEEEKLQLAEAIDMYGVEDVSKLASRVPTKKKFHVSQMLYDLKYDNRKQANCHDMNMLPFVELKTIDDLFLVGGTKPKDVMDKWMEYLKSFYVGDPYKYNKFKLLSNAFLIMSESAMPTKPEDPVDFRKLYYLLYRIFNDYYTTKNHSDTEMKLYLNELFARVVEDIKNTSDDEKLALYNIVLNWTSVNRMNALRVYGKTEPKIEPGVQQLNEIVKPNNDLMTECKVLHYPMIPSFNPLRLKSENIDVIPIKDDICNN